MQCVLDRRLLLPKVRPHSVPVMNPKKRLAKAIHSPTGRRVESLYSKEPDLIVEGKVSAAVEVWRFVETEWYPVKK